METIWFWLVACMLVAYVIFDGFDFGAGIVHFLVARTDAERRVALSTIGPVWDGNEVWLLAAGGTLYFAFPALYASSFSGFYLPLMMVLWLLILRGASIEFRNHLASPVWHPLWDAGFAVSSALLAIFFGAALGNVVRGVPLDASGEFFLPLWTDWTPGKSPGILDWYTVLAGVAVLAVLALHGALWVALKTAGEIEVRARRVAGLVWWGALGLIALLTLASFGVQPRLQASFAARPWGWLFPLVAIAALMAVGVMNRRLRERAAFLASSLFLAAMLVSAAFGLYPCVLPSNGDPARSLTIANASAAPYGLRVGLVWFIPGMLLVAVYFVYAYRSFDGKVGLEEQP
ncbi:MAG: cytochrome d ubiquinol oxidase subunit II [Bryobacteraceae bacterium]|jgi:cytochrome d ubiquinol oxidase subunit II